MCVVFETLQRITTLKHFMFTLCFVCSYFEMTLGDVAFGAVLTLVKEMKIDVLKDFPKLAALEEKILNHEGVQEVRWADCDHKKCIADALWLFVFTSFSIGSWGDERPRSNKGARIAISIPKLDIDISVLCYFDTQSFRYFMLYRYFNISVMWRHFTVIVVTQLVSWDPGAPNGIILRSRNLFNNSGWVVVVTIHIPPAGTLFLSF